MPYEFAAVAEACRRLAETREGSGTPEGVHAERVTGMSCRYEPLLLVAEATKSVHREGDKDGMQV